MPSRIQFAMLYCISCLGLLTLGCEPAPTTSAPPKAATTEHSHDHEEGDHDKHVHAEGNDEKEDHDHEHKEGDHDHEKHAHSEAEHVPETYADAVNEIESLRKSIKEHFDVKKLEEADSAVHEVGHILEEVVKLAEKASLNSDDLGDVKKNVDILFDAFEKIDDRLHSKGSSKGSDYSEVSNEIEAAVAVLKTKVKESDAGNSETPPSTESGTDEKEAPAKDVGDAVKDKEALEKSAAQK